MIIKPTAVLAVMRKNKCGVKDAMYFIHAVMRTYEVGCDEAAAYLNTDCTKAFLFSNGQAYVPRTFPQWAQQV